MQTKKIGCKQKRSDTNKENNSNKKDNANKKDRMQIKKIMQKKDRMQTKRIGCKQKTKTCHDASSNLDQLTPSLATSYKLQIMILKSWWTWLMGLIGLIYTKYSQLHIYSCPFDIIPFSFQFADPFLFASYLFCLHRDRFWFFVCIRSFLFACYLFCLQQTIFYCIDPCGPPYGTSSFSSDTCKLISIPVVFTQIVTENEF